MQHSVNQSRKKQRKQRFRSSGRQPCTLPGKHRKSGQGAGCQEPWLGEDSPPTAHQDRSPHLASSSFPRCWIIQRNHVKAADFRKNAAERMGVRHAGLGGGFCTGHQRPRCYKRILQQYWGELINTSYTWVFFVYLTTPLDVDMSLINSDTKHPGSKMKNCLWGKPRTEPTD